MGLEVRILRGRTRFDFVDGGPDARRNGECDDPEDDEQRRTAEQVPPGAVTSPMVGTAYLRPSPDAEQFKKSGDSVKEGETILLVEAMKTFNPITAPKSGTLKELLVDDAQPVEYGEALFIIG